MGNWPDILAAVSGVLSMVSTAILILVFIFKKSSRTYGFRLVLQLFIFDFILSTSVTIPTIIGLIDSDFVIGLWVCRLEGVVKLFSMLASFFATVMVLWTLYTHIIRGKPVKSKNPSLHFIGFTAILPFIMSLIPLAFDRIGPIDPYKNVMCFLCEKQLDGETDYIGITLRILIYYTPFFLVLIFDVYASVKIIRYFNQAKLDFRQYNDVKYLILYPIILLFSWIWMVLERIIESITQEPVVWLNNIDYSLAMLNGFLNAFVYGFISLDPCRSTNEESESEESNEVSLLQSENVQGSETADHINGCQTEQSQKYTLQSFTFKTYSR